MSLIFDTSFLIALNDSGDYNHKYAISLKSRIKNKEFGQCYISDSIFDELMTFLRGKSIPFDKIKAIGDAFTDCTTITLAKEFGIKHIASFDSDFDRFAHLKRI